MNKPIVVITCIMIAAMVVFPPYVAKNFNSVVVKSGYGFILALPSLETPSGRNYPTTVDIRTLATQVIILGGLGFLLAAIFKPKEG